jgi:lipoyl(octanoyl) transferase
MISYVQIIIGQLTIYPILDLRGYKQDIHWYMRALEEVILLSLHRIGIEEVITIHMSS